MPIRCRVPEIRLMSDWLGDVSLVSFAYIDASIYLIVLCNYVLISTFILRRKLAIERGVHIYSLP